MHFQFKYSGSLILLAILDKLKFLKLGKQNHGIVLEHRQNLNFSELKLHRKPSPALFISTQCEYLIVHIAFEKCMACMILIITVEQISVPIVCIKQEINKNLRGIFFKKKNTYIKFWEITVGAAECTQRISLKKILHLSRNICSVRLKRNTAWKESNKIEQKYFKMHNYHALSWKKQGIEISMLFKMSSWTPCCEPDCLMYVWLSVLNF